MTDTFENLCIPKNINTVWYDHDTILLYRKDKLSTEKLKNIQKERNTIFSKCATLGRVLGMLYPGYPLSESLDYKHLNALEFYCGSYTEPENIGFQLFGERIPPDADPKKVFDKLHRLWTCLKEKKITMQIMIRSCEEHYCPE